MSRGKAGAADISAGSAVSDERFWSKGRPEGECIVYSGSRDRQGYGHVLRIAVSRSPMQAHRYAWLLVNGSIPEGQVVMHTCDNPPCIRPEHLVLGTQGDNIADRDRKGRHRPGRLLGEAHPSHVLTDRLVLSIRELHAEGAPIKDIATLYGVHYGTVYQIVTRRTWTHLAA